MTDGFVDVKLGNARIAKTRVIDNSLDPEWNETFRVEVNDFLKTSSAIEKFRESLKGIF